MRWTFSYYIAKSAFGDAATTTITQIFIYSIQKLNGLFVYTNTLFETTKNYRYNRLRLQTSFDRNTSAYKVIYYNPLI